MKQDIVDFTVPEAQMHSFHFDMKCLGLAPWDAYFESQADTIFLAGGLIMDIGGGLRLDKTRCDREDLKRRALFGKYLSDPNVRFRVTDYTASYHPDFKEDIHRLSFESDSIDGLFCLAVLEHVYDPKKAAEELVRVLKPGAKALLYVPFMYRYHATVTEDYRDYYRYSKDGIAYLFRGCASVEICPVRGLFESLLRFTPLTNLSLVRSCARILDWSSARMRSISSKQASGYFIMITK